MNLFSSMVRRLSMELNMMQYVYVQVYMKFKNIDPMEREPTDEKKPSGYNPFMSTNIL